MTIRLYARQLMLSGLFLLCGAGGFPAAAQNPSEIVFEPDGMIAYQEAYAETQSRLWEMVRAQVSPEEAEALAAALTDYEERQFQVYEANRRQFEAEMFDQLDTFRDEEVTAILGDMDAAVRQAVEEGKQRALTMAIAGRIPRSLDEVLHVAFGMQRDQLCANRHERNIYIDAACDLERLPAAEEMGLPLAFDPYIVFVCGMPEAFRPEGPTWGQLCQQVTGGRGSPFEQHPAFQRAVRLFENYYAEKEREEAERRAAVMVPAFVRDYCEKLGTDWQNDHRGRSLPSGFVERCAADYVHQMNDGGDWGVYRDRLMAASEGRLTEACRQEVKPSRACIAQWR